MYIHLTRKPERPMIPVIPWYITLITVGMAILAGLAVWLILSAAAGRSGLAPISQRWFRIGAAVFLGGWLGAALLLAPRPSSLLATDRFAISPMIPVFALGSFAIALLAFLVSTTVRRVLGAAWPPALIGV